MVLYAPFLSLYSFWVFLFILISLSLSSQVTFREPEAATLACVDATPIIDGRQANCNIASQGRPRPSPPRGRLFLSVSLLVSLYLHLFLSLPLSLAPIFLYATMTFSRVSLDLSNPFLPFCHHHLAFVISIYLQLYATAV